MVFLFPKHVILIGRSVEAVVNVFYHKHCQGYGGDKSLTKINQEREDHNNCIPLGEVAPSFMHCNKSMKLICRLSY